MASARGDRADRLGVGQLLVRLLYHFREEMLAAAADGGHPSIRPPHLQVFANLRSEGIRLTELAARAHLSLAAASEFVTELEDIGYLERRPDPGDGRAKLILPTRKGRQLLGAAGTRVAEIEAQWATTVGSRRFEQTCQALQKILDELAGPEPSLDPKRPGDLHAPSS